MISYLLKNLLDEASKGCNCLGNFLSGHSYIYNKSCTLDTPIDPKHGGKHCPLPKYHSIHQSSPLTYFDALTNDIFKF